MPLPQVSGDGSVSGVAFNLISPPSETSHVGVSTSRTENALSAREKFDAQVADPISSDLLGLVTESLLLMELRRR
jgi:hypothetical protein